MMRKALWCSVAIAGASCAYALSTFSSIQYNRAPDTIVQPESVRIVAVGDIMLDRWIRKYAVEQFGGSYTPFFTDIAKFADGAVLFGNLEGPVSDIGNKVGSIYSFRMDPKVWDNLVSTKFNVLSFANNHVGDYSVAAYMDTLERAKSANIVLAGVRPTASSSPAVFTENNGIRIAWLAYTDVGPKWMAPTSTRGGVALLDEATLAQDVAQAKAQSNIVFVSVHWGEEYATHSNAHQQRIGRLAIDAGATAVIGHHPHVAQEIEEYNNGVIIYSLGNYIFDQNFSADTGYGLVVEMNVTKRGLVSLHSFRAKFDNSYVPHIAIEPNHAPF